MITDFPTLITPDGETRILNLVQSDPHFFALLKQGVEILPESEIKDFDVWPVDIKIKDQDSKGACNGHASATMTEICRALAGQAYVPLSAWWVYSILCGGVDQGSNIGEALTLLRDKGCAPESTVPYGLINPNNLTDGAKTAASRFRLEIGNQITTWEEIVSAIATGEAVNLSICVASNFNSLDAEGVPGVGRGAGNHAVCCAAGIKTSKKWGKLIKMPNSWGDRWGWKGFCWLSRDHIESCSWFEAIVAKAVADDPNDPDNPPVVA